MIAAVLKRRTRCEVNEIAETGVLCEYRPTYRVRLPYEEFALCTTHKNLVQGMFPEDVKVDKL